MTTIFSKIIKGEIPCYQVAEDERHLAFLDVRPVKRGHCLVIPKNEVDYIFDLDDQALADLHVFAGKVARAQRQAIPCMRIGVAVVGLEVPHVHIHLIPLDSIADLSFSGPRLDLDAAEFESIAAAIRARI
ncbi:MAG: HIT family protein [Leptospiraceae bacterium]|nr:HIT family protein [Leptospiraceae bacterium]